MALIGYARFHPRTNRRGTLDALRKVACTSIFEETASGANRDRPPPGHHAPGPIQALGQDHALHCRHLGRRDRGFGRGPDLLNEVISMASKSLERNSAPNFERP